MFCRVAKFLIRNNAKDGLLMDKNKLYRMQDTQNQIDSEKITIKFILYVYS
jgi:hypothetical protein